MMAENVNEYDEAFRESYVYISAEIQGNLERKKKGVLGGRSKQWCSLQGSTLYLQKKQKDVVEMIGMQDVHNVRKVTSEYTGTHFEISLKKKNYVFICPSSENCTAWVKALQTAISRMDSSHHSNHAVDTDNIDGDKHLYSEVDEALMSVSNKCNPLTLRIISKTSPKLSDYTEPYDKECDAGKKENDYWEVGELRKNLNKSKLDSGSVYGHNESDTCSSCSDTKQITAVKESSGKLSANQSNEVAVSDSTNKTSCNQDSCIDEYAQVRKVRKSSTSQDAVEEVHTISAPEMEVSLRTTPSSHASFGSGEHIDTHKIVISTEAEGDSIKHQVNSDGSEPFQILTDALSDRSSPVKEYIHPLTEEDRRPLEELTAFLRNNVDICRVSYSCIPINSDPVSSLKSYLGTLEIFVRKPNNNIDAAEQLLHKPSA